MYCSSICETLYTRLRQPVCHTFTVHSSFSGAVNLAGTDGLFFAVLPQSKELRPFTMTVTDFQLLELEPLQRAYFQDNSLITDSFRIPIRADASKSLKLPQQGLPSGCSPFYLLEPLLVGQTQSGFSRCALSFCRGEQISEFYFTLFQPLFTALKEKSCFSFARAACQIAGIGQGLTPSGDDFLCGLLLVLHQAGEDDMINSFLATGFAGRTNQISANYLRSAALGLAPDSIGRLLHYITAEGTGDVSSLVSYYFRRVTAFGATSGNDICTGIYWGFYTLAGL